MKVEGVELITVELPLVAPFRTSFGTELVREALLLRVVTDASDGWGECVALVDPVYSSEYVRGCADVLRRFLIPSLALMEKVEAQFLGQHLSTYHGHKMAKAALETGMLDAELKARGVSLKSELGASRDRVPCGVSVGIMDSIPQMLDAVEGYLADGYVRIKLKIEPGWDVAPVRAVREKFGDEVMLQVDANTAYRRQDTRLLEQLDQFDLVLIEQPLPEHDLHGHAILARQIRTPICLDESINSASDAAEAIRIGACEIVNIKPGRVGGLFESRRIHDVCAANGVPVWCGGMLETGIGRAANLALAGLANFTLPGDTSASRRYYHQDLTEEFEVIDGHMTIPDGPGIGTEPLADVMKSLVVEREWVRC